LFSLFYSFSLLVPSSFKKLQLFISDDAAAIITEEIIEVAKPSVPTSVAEFSI